MNAAAILGASLVALTACRTEQTIARPDPHLERMLQQEKRLAYRPDPLLPRGMVMQPPPEGTLPTDAIAAQPLLVEGVVRGRYADRIPISFDRAFVETGRTRFDTFCATCHGVLGDGVSAISEKMALRRPPSLHEAPLRDYPPGRTYEVVRRGYGLMPGYAVELSVSDSWAVVAYVAALRLAYRARVADLPRDVRDDLAKEAP